jgi:hypothetical protein
MASMMVVTTAAAAVTAVIIFPRECRFFHLRQQLRVVMTTLNNIRDVVDVKVDIPRKRHIIRWFGTNRECHVAGMRVNFN